ncbi:MAG TPA: TonB-dependent receptor [Chitinophagaceae bacterium]|nr:TonB-dependent receptor [Chitinophagaceae bacterium]
MKLTSFLLLVFVLQANAKTYSQKVTFSGKQVKLEKVFASIRRQTGYVFFYNTQLLDEAKPVSLDVKDASLLDVLQMCFKGQPLDFNIENRTIVISKKQPLQPAPPPPVVPSAPPPVEIHGKVTDVTGKALAGVSVVVKGTSHGVATDENGYFSITAMADAYLTFSYVGYSTQEVPVGNKTQVDVRLVQSLSSLNDVVVVGYGSQQRSSITSAISTVSSKSVENQQLASFDQAIAGQAAGVQVSQVTGTPGGGVSIRVRGTGSISAGNEPLYVVDGFPIEGSYARDLNPLATLNPNDIESIQILKDASSAAIYGSRGSNGVVIITTKRGKAGKPAIEFDTYYGLQQVAHKVDMLDAHDYAVYNTEARNNAWVDHGGNASDPNSARPTIYQIPPMFQNPDTIGKGTDWQDAIFQTAPMQSYQLKFSGGNDNSQYLVSGNYFNQEGIVIHSGFERYSFRLNLDSKISNRFRIGANIAPSYSKSDILPVADQVFTGGIIGSALAMPPTIPVYNPDGTFTTQLGGSPYNTGVIDNPVAIASKIKSSLSTFRTLGMFFADYDILDNLKFKTSFGIDYQEGRSSYFSPSDLGRNGVLPPVIPIGNAASSRGYNLLNENTLTYNNSFKGGHSLTVLAGFTSQKSRSDNMTLSAINFPNNLVTTLNAGQISTGGTTASEWALLSYIGRVNYSYRSKYLVTASVRRDGSSRFGLNNRWGVFPSASAGWYISKEKFMANVKAVSDLKLRGSYGIAGNNTIGDYSSIGLLAANRYVLGTGTGTVVNGLQPVTLSNTDLGWEKMRQLDIGLDLGLINNRVYLVVDYYNKITSNLLLNVPVPGSTGYTNALENIGKVGNKGWEFALSTKNITGAFTWNTDFNIAFDRNRVLALGPKGDPIISTSPSFSPQTHITQIGGELGDFYGYKVIGIYQNADDVAKSPVVAGATGSHPGDLKFQDTNGDGVITSADETVIGSNHPKYTFGMTNTFSYKSFSLSVLVDGVQGVDVLNGARRNIGLVSESYSRSDVLGRWQSPDNPGDGHTPRANTSPTGGNVSFVSSLLIEDASFVRIRNINLRYTLPAGLLKKASIQNASVYFSVQNAFTFTGYKGYNPEQSLNGVSPLTPGVDFNGYPVARVYTLGLHCTF